MYKTHTVCRACGYGSPGNSNSKSAASTEKLEAVFDLGVTPLANDFERPGGEHKGYAPLRVLFCPRCTLAQLSVVVNPDILYANYPYVTSRSQTMLEHFGSLWKSIQNECSPESVVEIGSNDGWFLDFCRKHGADAVIGIDPAENLKPGNDSGIITITSLFDEKSAAIARGAMPAIKVIVARHVFAHVDDWASFMRNLDVLANKDTLIVIECPYVMDLLERVEFDTIYHEHLSYISIKSVNALLEGTPFHLHKVERFPIHGGALAMMIRRNDSEIDRDPSVEEFLAGEVINRKVWNDFSYNSRLKIHNLRGLVEDRVGQGYHVCGFGASAKSTVWVNACQFTKSEIAFIADSTRLKWGRFSPGSDIPIVDEGALLRERPEFSVCFAWNFIQEIQRTQSRYLELGGKFIVPMGSKTPGGIRIVEHSTNSDVVNHS